MGNCIEPTCDFVTVRCNRCACVYAVVQTTEFCQVKKYDSKAAIAGTPKPYSTGEDMVVVKKASKVFSRWCESACWGRRNIYLPPCASTSNKLISSSAPGRVG